MLIEIPGPCLQPLHHSDEYSLKCELLSVGIWTLVKEKEITKYALLVRQADQVGKPWGIPAGGYEETDGKPINTARRELGEETGIWLPIDRFNYLHFLLKRGVLPKKGHLLYVAHLDMGEVSLRNSEEVEQVILFDPPAEVSGQGEIDKLVLVPIHQIVDSSFSVQYHRTETYLGHRLLRLGSYI